MIIGISGKIGTGKDLVGKIIQVLTNNLSAFKGLEVITEKQVNYKVWDNPKFKTHKLADALKDMICISLRCTRERLEDRDFKERELSPEWWYWKGVDRLLSINDYSKLNEIQKEYFELVKTTPRLLLQLMGTECGRQILHPDVWVNAVMTNYKPINYIISSFVLLRWITDKGIYESRIGLFDRVAQS